MPHEKNTISNGTFPPKLAASVMRRFHTHKYLNAELLSAADGSCFPGPELRDHAPTAFPQHVSRDEEDKHREDGSQVTLS